MIAKETFRKHFLRLLLNVRVDLVFLIFLYSYEDGMLDKFHLQLYMKQNFHGSELQEFGIYELLMYLSTRGHKGLKAFVEGMVFTDQFRLANEIEPDIAKQFLDKREEYNPSF